MAAGAQFAAARDRHVMGLPEENGAVVDGFLAARTDFRRAPVREAAPAELLTPDGDLEIQPQRHGMDGAFAARLVRAA